ncbi:hypothetical protein ES708_34994 [subsurface metagenome]
MWDWWDDTYDTVSGAIGDAWDTTTDFYEEQKENAQAWIDYGWDVATDFVEDQKENVSDWIDYGEWWVRDTFDIPDQEGKGFLGEVGDKIGEEIDKLGTKGKEEWEKFKAAAGDTYNYYYEEGEKFIKGAGEKAGDAAATVAAKVGDIIANIELALGIGFDLAMMAIIDLPDLLTGFKTDLSEWFKFDVEAFMVKLEEYSERMKPEGVPTLTEEGD